MKPASETNISKCAVPAAFGRLCVETSDLRPNRSRMQPAAFGRLCVETHKATKPRMKSLPAAFGRLCVETLLMTLLA